jgi:hypothetical protein
MFDIGASWTQLWEHFWALQSNSKSIPGGNNNAMQSQAMQSQAKHSKVKQCKINLINKNLYQAI